MLELAYCINLRSLSFVVFFLKKRSHSLYLHVPAGLIDPGRYCTQIYKNGERRSQIVKNREDRKDQIG